MENIDLILNPLHFRLYGTHYLGSVTMGGKMNAVSFTKDWIEEKETEEDVARQCVESHHRKKFNVLQEVSESERKSTCRNPQITEIFQSQASLETEELHSIGAPLGSSDDFSEWSARSFDQPAPVKLQPQPLLNLFISNKFFTRSRILARDGSLQ